MTLPLKAAEIHYHILNYFFTFVHPVLEEHNLDSIFLRSAAILFSHPCVCLPSGALKFSFQNSFVFFIILPVLRATLKSFTSFPSLQ
jgi:hypothetical protein